MLTDSNLNFDKENKVAILKVISQSSATLHFENRIFSAAIGRNSIRIDKREGDGATPVGFLPVRRLLYRADRIQPPNTCVSCEKISENDGWCDDITHSDYNRQIKLPHPARHEKLWLDDNIYDIIGVLGYNDDPIIVGEGSAIFLHIAQPNMTPTDGCIALRFDDLCWILEQELRAIYVSN